MEQLESCITSHSMVSDVGSCNDASDGNSFIAIFSATGVDLREWGATTDGTTDVTTQFQAALNALKNQTLLLGTGSYFIASNVTMQNGTTIKGTFGNVGAPNYHSTFYDFTHIPAIHLSSSATINTANGSTIDGVLLYRAGMTFPAANSSAFAGTAILVGGDSFTIKNSLVMGFAYGVTSGIAAGFGCDQTHPAANGFDKGLIEDMNFDNQSNICVNAAADTWKIHSVHAWPWAAGAQGTGAAIERTGVNLQESNSNDAMMITDFVQFGC